MYLWLEILYLKEPVNYLKYTEYSAGPFEMAGFVEQNCQVIVNVNSAYDRGDASTSSTSPCPYPQLNHWYKDLCIPMLVFGCDTHACIG